MVMQIEICWQDVTFRIYSKRSENSTAQHTRWSKQNHSVNLHFSKQTLCKYEGMPRQVSTHINTQFQFANQINVKATDWFGWFTLCNLLITFQKKTDNKTSISCEPAVSNEHCRPWSHNNKRLVFYDSNFVFIPFYTSQLKVARVKRCSKLLI